MQTSSFLPTEINSWCWGAQIRLEAKKVKGNRSVKVSLRVADKATYMRPVISSAATMCPTIQRFYSPNCGRRWRPNCMSPEIRNRRCLCCGIDNSGSQKKSISWKFKWSPSSQLTKNDRLHCDASPACHKLKLPSPSAIPNFIAMLWESATRHLGKSAWRSWSTNNLLMTPFPHLHRTILSARQIQWHQWMRTHPFDVVHFVFQHLEWKNRENLPHISINESQLTTNCTTKSLNSLF